MIRSSVYKKRSSFSQQCLTSIVIVLCFLVMHVSTVYAACSACDMTPDELSNYFRVMDKILTIVDTPPMKTATDGTESALEE